jgi:hypothetical protein
MGGYENVPNGPAYEDKLYINDGKGISHSITALPRIHQQIMRSRHRLYMMVI